jgi:pyruvate,water dikinase
VLERPEDVRELHLGELRSAMAEGHVAIDLRARRGQRPGAPLPMAFRLAVDDVPVPVAVGRSGSDGLGASAGRGIGVVCHDPAALRTDEPCVLVVSTLDPRLAGALPGLAGLVSETGSTLSHLAILAREMNVPTVVAVPDARTRFPVGSCALVDGSTGEVSLRGAEGPA